ncbi:MAG: hypothetical protein IJ806_02240 [Ruminococcus sp.]|nr:hypothetical protein [Ruminococcus sp.]
MSELNIDKLSIEINSSAEQAASGIDKLIDRLNNLSNAVQNCKGLTRLNNQLSKINATISTMTGMANLERLITALEKLSNLKAPNITKTVNAINKLTAAMQNAGTISGTDQLAANVQAVSDALKPMENMGKNNMAGFLKSLQKIPEVTASLNSQTIAEFAARVRELTSALEPLLDAVSQNQAGLAALNGVMQQAVTHNGNLAASNAVTIRTYTSISKALKSFRVRLLAGIYVVRRLANVMSDWLKESNEYVENLNLFTVTMGKASKAAFGYAQTVHDALGIDVSEWIRNQGVFKQITSGFGVVTEKADLMSKNLTQIGYDISSFFNIGTEDAMQKVQSGIAGELEPLRRLGYALDKATLQQIAYDNGITQNINTMTQAQKSQLRYIAILQQSSNVMGDMARTVVTPANAMRILKQQITQLHRALGNIISVFATKFIPYVQAAIRILTELADKLAEKWGFRLPEIDYSSLGDGISGLSDEADEAAESVHDLAEEIFGLAGFDEITILPFKEDSSGSGTDELGNQFDLGIDLPEYDFLKGLDTSSDDIYERMKTKVDDLIEAFTLLNKIRDDFKYFKDTGDWYPLLTDLNKFVEKTFGKKWTSIWNDIGEAMYDGINDGDWYPLLVASDDLVRYLFGSPWTDFWESVGEKMNQGIKDGNWYPLLKSAENGVTVLFGKQWTQKWETVGRQMYKGIHEGDWYPFLKTTEGMVSLLFGSRWKTFWESAGAGMYEAFENHNFYGLLEEWEQSVRALFGSPWTDFWEGVGESIYNALHPGETDYSISVSSSGKTHGNATGRFAEGGYPQKYQLFMARENGIPEMVGRIGSQTAVANNDQITAAIAYAVKAAILETGLNSRNNNGEGGDINVYVGGKKFTDVIIDGINDRTEKNGKSPLR